MPIKDQSIYPKNWKAISREVRFTRAQGRCECSGECGLHRTTPGPRRCTERHGEPARWAKGKVILTVAHLDAPGGPCRHKKPCGWRKHLKAMCQRCHLRYDHPRHMANARATREAKAPQMKLL